MVDGAQPLGDTADGRDGPGPGPPFGTFRTGIDRRDNGGVPVQREEVRRERESIAAANIGKASPRTPAPTRPAAVEAVMTTPPPARPAAGYQQGVPASNEATMVIPQTQQRGLPLIAGVATTPMGGIRPGGGCRPSVPTAQATNHRAGSGVPSVQRGRRRRTDRPTARQWLRIVVYAQGVRECQMWVACGRDR